MTEEDQEILRAEYEASVVRGDLTSEEFLAVLRERRRERGWE